MKRKRKGSISGDTNLLEKFIEDKNVIDLLALYLVYESDCVFEGCEVEQQSDEKAMYILKWKLAKYNRIKNKLIELGLIEICPSYNYEETRVYYTYVHVNFLMP